MRLDAPERRELILAMQDGFNLPQRLGDFLRDKFNRNLAIIEAECPDTIGLYDYVVRIFEGEGLLLELLRRACETLAHNALLKAIRDRLFEKSGSPDGHHLRTCLLLRSTPIVNRHALRRYVDELARSGGARILVVDGPTKSGRSFSRWYVHHVCEIEGGRFYPIELKRYIGRQPIDLVRRMASFFGWRIEDIPAQHAQAAQWTEELGEWVAGRFAEQQELVWIVMDDCSVAGLEAPMREFVVYLAEKATFVKQMRVVLLAYTDGLGSIDKIMIRRDDIKMPTQLDVRNFLADYMCLKQILIDEDGLDFLADNIWSSLPKEPDKILVELPVTVRVALSEFVNV